MKCERSIQTLATGQLLSCWTRLLISMKRLLNEQWLQISGYAFISIVSIYSAIRTEELLQKILLVVSTIVSLILAVSRLYSSKKMSARIYELEKRQLSLKVDDEVLVFEQGNKD